MIVAQKQRFLVVNREFFDEMAISPVEQSKHSKQYMKTKDVSYVESKTDEGQHHMRESSEEPVCQNLVQTIFIISFNSWEAPVVHIRRW